MRPNKPRRRAGCMASAYLMRPMAVENCGFSKAEVWRDIHPTRPGDNVYFELEPTDEDEEAPTTVLGIWTTHIALLFGRPLKGADIQAIYPRSEPEAQSR